MEQTYKKFIDSILLERGRHGCKEKYYEQHHIIPKCMRGRNNEENLIDLYAHEHFIAHKLLAKETPNNEKLVNAYAMMTFMRNDNHKRTELAPEEYEKVRIAFSNIMKNKWKDPEYRQLQIEHLKNRWKDPEYRKTQSEMRTRLNHEMWSNPEFKKAAGAKVKERWENSSDEFKQEAREAMRETANKLWQDLEYVKRHCEPVFCIETGEYFFKQQDAAQKYNINITGICNYLKGRQKSAGKHPITREKLHWKSVSWDEYYQNVPELCPDNKINLSSSNVA